MEEEPLVCFDGRKTCSPTTIRKRKLASQKLVMIFLYSFQGFATTFIINQMVENNGVFPREAISTLCRLAGRHLGPVYQGGNGEALRLKCLHLQVKACIWGILESLIRANLDEEGQMHDLLKWLGLAR